MDVTKELNALVDAAHTVAASRAAAGSFYAGYAKAEISGHSVSCHIEPNTRNGRGVKNVVQKGWYLDGKRTSIAKVVAAIGSAP